MRRFMTLIGALLLLAGCDRVTVEQVRVPEPKSSPAESPHGLMPPHGEIQPGAAVEAGGPEVRLEKVQLTAPKSWSRQQPRSGFILAEFALPKVKGDEADGRLTVSVAGGSLADNLARWRSQFIGKPQKDSEEKLDVSGVKVTLVDLSGTYSDQRGMMGPGVERPDYRLLGAIFAVDGQMHFLKAYGPAKTMAAHADEFRAMVRSLKLNSTGG
jgi:hypothetical protein